MEKERTQILADTEGSARGEAFLETKGSGCRMIYGFCRAMWTQKMSNPNTRNRDATLNANASLSFVNVLFAHDPNSISITSFETDTACGFQGIRATYFLSL